MGLSEFHDTLATIILHFGADIGEDTVAMKFL
jgi:hypothetical protein